MNFGQAVVSGFRNYINFSGRASRSEFWFFMLFFIPFPYVGGVADYFLFDRLALEGLGPLQLLTKIAFLLPLLVLSARRFHDIDRTGWWLPVMLTPWFIPEFVLRRLLNPPDGWIRLEPLAPSERGIVLAIWSLQWVPVFFWLIWFCMKGTTGPNRFGADPLRRA